ncbi:cytochrome P450 4C1-like [Homalodisca vitripennis]|uniref:cytochrome P450 4C1-like n=1 Tax=Homalodisca vitripennis TaxID=197043 RepID=UPI001EE9B055|nr:cytochrome P450 4C1-like [Homalodisca vitripennis]
MHLQGESAELRVWPLLWSVLVFCITWPTITLVRDWLRVFLRVQHLPGPQGHPIFGNVKEYLSRHRFFQYAAKWREHFPAFHKTLVLFHPLIIVQSPDAVQAILSRKHKHNEKGMIYQGLRSLLGEGLITSKGDRWHSHRKLITPTFHFNILESFVDVFVARTADFMKDLNIFLADNDLSEKFNDISPFTRKLTLDFICETAMGTPADSNRLHHKEIVNAMHRLEEIGIYRMVRPWLLSDFIFQFTAKGREERKYRHILHSFTDQVIRRRRQALQAQEEFGYIEDCPKKRAIFMDLLITSSRGGSLLSDQDIREEVNTFMFAGQNTTQLAINYCLYLLGENPQIQAKAYAELYEIFGDSDRQPTMEDLKAMKYLENCIKEALRLFPSVPVIARKLTEDEVFGKYTLPRGADVLVLPYVLHRDASQFPDPERFNPDNFLPEAVKLRHPYAYIPFSAGPRNCIGQKFAILAEKTVLSAILRKYKISSLHSRQELIVVPNTVLVPKTCIFV